jgi:hypothetical protein
MKEKSIYKSILILNIYFVFMFILIFSSCKKETTTPSVTPSIELKSATPTSVTEFSDPLTFTFSYKDGDGDLGENNPDVKNLFLKDNRIGITYQYRIQQLAPTNSNIAIQGTLNVQLDNVSITDQSTSQQATFSIYVVDRAGHQSNTVTSLPITIHKP